MPNGITGPLSKRTCGSCSAAGVTKEHVWADWLRKLILQARSQPCGKTFHAEIETGSAMKQFKSKTLEVTVGMPCSSWNNGWMSVLENEVRLFMPGMIRCGDTTLLTREQQVSLAHWAIKTAMVLLKQRPTDQQPRTSATRWREADLT